MLVVISDLHLTDGTCGPTAPAGVFHLLSERLGELAANASARADGSYRPIERIDLLLLGDVLDLMNSSRWLDYDARPWSDLNSVELADAVSSIAGDIIRRNDAALGVLRSLAQGSVRLTPASQMGRRAATSEAAGVPVRIHYMVGNRDWLFHLPGQAFDRLRRQLVVHLGLVNEADAPFAHDPGENGELLQVLRRHRVLARHGDIFDPLAFEGHRDCASITDMIVIELLVRFNAEVERNLSRELSPNVLTALADVDYLRPLVLAPIWIEGLLSRMAVVPSAVQRVKRLWDRLVETMLDQSFVRESDAGRRVGLVDGLARALRFSHRPATDWAQSTNRWLCGLRGAANASFADHALAEEEFRNRRARHIVYGHTHQAEEVPLEASSADAFVLNQSYFNTGAARRSYRPTRGGAGGREFVASESLSLLAFFQGDERGGRPYEMWTGTLGINPNEARAAMRVDAAAQSTPASSTSAPTTVPIRALHFRSSPSTISFQSISDV